MAAQHTPPNRGQRRPAPEGAARGFDTATVAPPYGPREYASHACRCCGPNDAALAELACFRAHLVRARTVAARKRALATGAKRLHAAEVCQSCGLTIIGLAALGSCPNGIVQAEWLECFGRETWGPVMQVDRVLLLGLTVAIDAVRGTQASIDRFGAIQAGISRSLGPEFLAGVGRYIIEDVLEWLRPEPLIRWVPAGWSLSKEGGPDNGPR